MHGGTHTNWFNYRYSFVFSFFLIALATEEFEYINEVTIKDVKRAGIILLVSTMLVFSTQYEYISGGSVVLDLSLLIVMWLLVRAHIKKPQRVTKKVMAGLLLLTVSINLYVNFSQSVECMVDWEKDLSQYETNTLLAGGTIDALKMYDTSFYRMEKDVSESGSAGVDSALYGYNGVGSSGPTIRMFVHKQLNKLGISWFDMRHWYAAGVPAATDALLGLKYIMAHRDDIDQEKDYPTILTYEKGGVYVYENPNRLGIAILADNDCTEIELGSNVFENLNEVWKKMSNGSADIFTTQEDVYFELHNLMDSSSATIEEAKNYLSSSLAGEQPDDSESAYIETEFIAEQTGPVYRCNTLVPESENGSEYVTVEYCGYYQQGETVNDTIIIKYNYATKPVFMDICAHILYAYGNNDVLAEYAAKLNDRDISFNVEKETDLTGTFTASEGQVILFTIPWDEGWTAYIDGQEVPISKTWDLFMSIEAPAGKHTYEMKFFPAWMDYGLYLCGAAFVGLVIMLIIWKGKIKDKDISVGDLNANTGEIKPPNETP